MKPLYMNGEVYIGIEGRDIPVIQKGLAMGLSDQMPQSGFLLSRIETAIKQAGKPEYWSTSNVISVSSEIDMIGALSLAIRTYKSLSPIKATEGTMQHAAEVQGLQIANHNLEILRILAEGDDRLTAIENQALANFSSSQSSAR